MMNDASDDRPRARRTRSESRSLWGVGNRVAAADRTNARSLETAQLFPVDTKRRATTDGGGGGGGGGGDSITGGDHSGPGFRRVLPRRHLVLQFSSRRHDCVDASNRRDELSCHCHRTRGSQGERWETDEGRRAHARARVYMHDMTWHNRQGPSIRT